ncbi:Hypothetical protein, putative [Bodo saltans]|uniref:Uncharacterized protein n=1 Tax=Bodo saltans TaxID=75058 RepID=A0A0S4IYG4_BODSA|nr:Hypothetical protein, putative [Bodo saltans]|eukprot:CUG01156.1 Hypothetical protein, putative [Bodo saltans]
MMRLTTSLLKNPVNFKQGQGMVTHQLKRLLQKKHLHKYNWDPLPMYEPRKLVHANRYVDHHTYQEKVDPHWSENTVSVPDQKWLKVDVPAEYQDAYWFRDLQARRVQCPVEWVSHRMYKARHRRAYDFQDLGFKKKHIFLPEEAAENAKSVRN